MSVNQIEKIEGVQWRLKNIQIASSAASIVVNSGFIYCIGYTPLSRYASFCKINVETGCLVETMQLDERVISETQCFSSLVIVGNRAYFLYQPTTSGPNPKVYCVDTDFLEVIFRVDVYNSLEHLPQEGTVYAMRRHVRSSILVVNDNIYIGTRNGCVCCYNREDGGLVWALPITNGFAIGHVAYFENYLYVESSSRKLYSIDIEKREVKWKFDCPGIHKEYLNWNNLSPLVCEETVYLYASVDSIYAVERETGKLKWKYSSSAIKIHGCDSVMAPGLLISVMPDESIHGISMDDGKQVWNR